MAYRWWAGPGTRPVTPPGTFDRIDGVRESIRELYTKLSGPAVKTFGALALPPSPGRDPLLDAQALARTMARHLGVGDVRLIVAFTRLGDGTAGRHAGEVELGPGPEYFITLSSRYQEDPRDIAAVLAHEVMHVFLHRKGIRFAGLPRNEILTDTATLYLGIGRPMLNAYRVDVARGIYVRRRTTSRVGYLSPPEMGYVLAKRALAFGESNRPLTTGPAQAAYNLGHQRALADYDHAPLAGCSRSKRRQYEQDKRYAVELTRSTGMAGQARPFPAGYRFEGFDPINVVFACPACGHGTRVAIGKSAILRCGVCRSTFRCTT